MPVILLDISGSISLAEFELQRDGVVAAMHDQDVLASIRSGMHGKVAISVVFWSNRQRFLLPWVIVSGKEEANAIAIALRHAPRGDLGSDTALGAALRFAGERFAYVPCASPKWVIDVSGNGRSNAGTPVEEAVAALQANEIVINTLPIVLKPDLELEVYFRDKVQSGAGSFTQPANGYGAFAKAFRRKLTIELSQLPAANRW